MNIRKISLKSIVILIHIIFSMNVLSAQNTNQSGYIITKTNDTIRGYIQNVNINQYTKCLFKKELNSPTVVYLPGEILGYRFKENGKFFISKEILQGNRTKIIFLEYLIKGKANIYLMRNNKDHYFIQKEGEKFIELSETPVLSKDSDGRNYYPPQKYTGKLKYTLSDCPEIYTEIDDIKLNPTQLIKLAKDYHNKVCNTEHCIIYERKIKPVKFNFGVLAGVSYTDFIFNANNYTDKGASAFAGGKVEIENLMPTFERFTVNTGFIVQYFSNYNFHTDSYVYNNVVYTENTVSVHDMQSTTLKIPLTFNYMFTQSKCRPYIGAGITNRFFMKQNKSIYITDFTDYYGQAIPFFHLGYIGLTGIKYLVNNKHSVFLEFNYEQMQNMNMNEILRIHNRTFSIQAGYIF